MANNFNVVNPYTTKVPGGTLTQVELVNPRSVQIQWPNRSGGNLPSTETTPSILKRLFG